jgi:hypothetical protein
MSSKHGFSIDQLMELAGNSTEIIKKGLSVANTVYKCFPKEKYSNILIICGPGSKNLKFKKQEITEEMVRKGLTIKFFRFSCS